MEERFFAALDSAASDPSVRVIVVTGAGRAFCAGARYDCSAMAIDPAPGSRAAATLCELVEFPKPVIAAVNGPAPESASASQCHATSVSRPRTRS